MHTLNTPTDCGWNIQQMNYKDYIKRTSVSALAHFLFLSLLLHLLSLVLVHGPQAQPYWVGNAAEPNSSFLGIVIYSEGSVLFLLKKKCVL